MTARSEFHGPPPPPQGLRGESWESRVALASTRPDEWLRVGPFQAASAGTAARNYVRSNYGPHTVVVEGRAESDGFYMYLLVPSNVIVPNPVVS